METVYHARLMLARLLQQMYRWCSAISQARLFALVYIQTSCLFKFAASHWNRPSSAWVSNVDISVSRIVTLSPKNMQHANVLRKKAPVAGLFFLCAALATFVA